jgi:hypothetical protein
MNLTLYFVNDSNIARKFKRCGFPTAGAEFKMAAQYFDILPEHAAVDLNPLPSTFS